MRGTIFRLVCCSVALSLDAAAVIASIVAAFVVSPAWIIATTLMLVAGVYHGWCVADCSWRLGNSYDLIVANLDCVTQMLTAMYDEPREKPSNSNDCRNPKGEKT